MIMAYCEFLHQKGDIDAFIRHNFMTFVISKCEIKGILMLKLMFGAKFRLLKLTDVQTYQTKHLVYAFTEI